MRPVDAADGRQPHRPDFMFRGMCMKGQYQGQKDKKLYNRLQNLPFLMNFAAKIQKKLQITSIIIVFLLSLRSEFNCYGEKENRPQKTDGGCGKGIAPQT